MYTDLFEILVPGYKEKLKSWGQQNDESEIKSTNQFIIQQIEKADLNEFYLREAQSANDYYNGIFSVWGKAIEASELHYHMICEIAESTEVIADMEHIFEYTCMRIFSNAIRIYASIIKLIRTGFLHGAIGLCRTLEEESIVLEFIINNGEEAALSYYKEKDKPLIDRDGYEWAKPFVYRNDNDKKKIVTLNELRSLCVSEPFLVTNTEAYRYMCKFAHSSPQTIFNDYDHSFNQCGLGPSIKGLSLVGMFSSNYIGNILFSLLKTDIAKNIQEKVAVGITWIYQIQDIYMDAEKKLLDV